MCSFFAAMPVLSKLLVRELAQFLQFLQTALTGSVVDAIVFIPQAICLKVTSRCSYFLRLVFCRCHPSNYLRLSLCRRIGGQVPASWQAPFSNFARDRQPGHSGSNLCCQVKQRPHSSVHDARAPGCCEAGRSDKLHVCIPQSPVPYSG